jgi:hypothetical protein
MPPDGILYLHPHLAHTFEMQRNRGPRKSHVNYVPSRKHGSFTHSVLA